MPVSEAVTSSRKNIFFIISFALSLMYLFATHFIEAPFQFQHEVLAYSLVAVFSNKVGVDHAIESAVVVQDVTGQQRDDARFILEHFFVDLGIPDGNIWIGSKGR